MNSWFPGRLIGGTALLVAPLVWFAGFLLRYLIPLLALTPEQRDWAGRQPFAGPGQLAAYATDPALVTLAYAVFALGAVLLFPAFVALAHLAGGRLAYWGATFVVAGLFARFYFAGVDQTAVQLTEVIGLDQATKAVMTEYTDISYGPWRVPVWCSVGQYLGSLLLAVGAWRTGVLGTGRAIAVLLPGLTWMGVLKESTLPDVVCTALMCAALVPLGIQVLRGRLPERGSRPKALSW